MIFSVRFKFECTDNDIDPSFIEPLESVTINDNNKKIVIPSEDLEIIDRDYTDGVVTLWYKIVKNKKWFDHIRMMKHTRD